MISSGMKHAESISSLALCECIYAAHNAACKGSFVCPSIATTIPHKISPLPPLARPAF